jgi:hypothetical protein
MAKKLYQFMFIDVFNEPDDVVGSGFAQDVFAVCFNGPFTDAELTCYLFVVELPFDEANDFQFTKGKGGTFRGTF